MLRHLKLKWLMRFPRFYKHPIYWYYYRLQGWGKKNGIPCFNNETSLDYVKKIMKHIPEERQMFTIKHESYDCYALLHRLNQDYQALYYGSEEEKAPAVEVASTNEYKLLLYYLKSIRLKKLRHFKKFANLSFMNRQK